MMTWLRQFFRRNWAFARLGALSNLEYRLNFVVDALVQPIVAAFVEVTLWLAVFHLSKETKFGGFTREEYLSYVIWAAFVSRLTVNWMYEFRMISEIESGSLNSLLVRPTSFFECYFSQFMGYKSVTTMFSILIPLFVTWYWDFPVHWERLPLTLGVGFFYLVFVYLLSFCLATTAFHLTRIWGLTVAKNLALAVFSGEIIPLDLFGPAVKSLLLWLPFASGVYVPVGYLTGRIGIEVVQQGLGSLLIGTLLLSAFAVWVWRKGLQSYAGTGA